jgi:hypothetical protein
MPRKAQVFDAVTPPANILDAMSSPQWWGPWFADGTWAAWRGFLAAVFGLPLPSNAQDLFRACTGLETPPSTMAREVYAIAGRRAGKTRVTSLIAAWLGCFVNWSPYLSRGERAHILLVGKDRDQAGVAFNYIEALIADHPVLKQLIKSSSAGTLELTNNVTIRVAAASFRGLRGYAIAGILMDELASWHDSETSTNPAAEIVRAIRPATLQFRGQAMILGLSSPLERRGVLWEAYDRNFGKPGSTLVWLAPTETMHPLSPEERAQIDAERAKDPEGAAAEYDCVWRDDVSGFLDAPLVERCTDHGVTMRAALPDVDYQMCVDFSDGKSDSTCAAIGHLLDGRIIVDALFEKKAPFQPSDAFRELAAFAGPYRITRVQIDKFAAGLVGDGLSKVGLLPEVRERSTSDVYLLAVPSFTEGAVRLLDDRQLAHQLTILQRRVGPSGKATVTHPPRTHDDLAAAVCSLVVMLATDARPLLIDHRGTPDEPIEPSGIFGVLGTLWIAADGRYGWVVCGCYDNVRAGEEKQIILAVRQGAWNWSVLDEIAVSMDAACEVAPWHQYKVRGLGVGAVLLVQDQIAGSASLAMERVFSQRVSPQRPDWENRNVGVQPIEASWLADPAGMLLSVSGFVGTGRVRQSVAVAETSGPGSVLRLLSVKPGERVEDDPLRVAMLINIAQMADDLPASRGTSRIVFQ